MRRALLEPGNSNQGGAAESGIVVLLLAALSTFRRVAELAARDLGFAPAGALALDLAPSPQRYPDAPALAARYRDVLGGLEELGAARRGLMSPTVGSLARGPLLPSWVAPRGAQPEPRRAAPS